MISILLIILLPFSLWAADPTFINVDPYLKPTPAATHEIQIRIFQHGLKGKEKLIQEQLHYAETVFSQCPGLAVKITPIKFQNLKSSTQQENMTEFKGSTTFFTKRFLKFMTPFSSNRPQDVVDVHMTEYMNKDVRKTQKLDGQITYGQSFNPTILNHFFNDPRPSYQQNPSLKDLAGDRVFLAISTVALQRNSLTRYPYGISKPRSYSLLAHELGHLILANYDAQTGFYGDHWCPDAGTYCEKGYLMSSGGNNDAYYLSLDSSKIIGYDPLPLMDTLQCEKLRTSRLVHKL